MPSCAFLERKHPKFNLLLSTAERGGPWIRSSAAVDLYGGAEHVALECSSADHCLRGGGGGNLGQVLQINE